jgi:hypothetical protein
MSLHSQTRARLNASGITVLEGGRNIQTSIHTHKYICACVLAAGERKGVSIEAEKASCRGVTAENFMRFATMRGLTER